MIAFFEGGDELELRRAQHLLGSLSSTLFVRLPLVDDGDDAKARHKQRRQQHQGRKQSENAGEPNDVVAAGHGIR